MQKVLHTTKIVVITLLVVSSVGLYLFLHAEKVSNEKTLELKNEQINQLKGEVESLKAQS